MSITKIIIIENIDKKNKYGLSFKIKSNQPASGIVFMSDFKIPILGSNRENRYSIANAKSETIQTAINTDLNFSIVRLLFIGILSS